MNKKIFVLVSIMTFFSVLLLVFGEVGFDLNQVIVSEIRIPKIISCVLGGGLLAIAGLLMQMYFQNPLAGPDVLGVSSGSILMVAVWTLASFLLPESIIKLGTSVMSLIGAILTFSLLMIYTHKNKSKVTLIILGVLISSFVSSLVTVMINASPLLQLKSFLLWSQGSFRNILKEEVIKFVTISILSLLPLIYFKKDFNLLSLGESYAKSMGVNIKNTRKFFVLLTSIYVSIVTIYCGPISFIGIIAPFMAKKIIKKSSLNELIPASFLAGSIIALLTELILVLLPSIPLTANSVLGFLGAPILVYYVYRQRDLLV